MSDQSVFPSAIDSFQILQDLPPDKYADSQTLQQLMSITNPTSDQIAQINSLLIELAPYYMSVSTWNRMGNGIVNMQNYLVSTYKNYYKYCGNYNGTTIYQIFNTVTFTDGNIYLLYNISPSYVAGIDCTNSTYWQQIGGTFNFRGNYDSNKSYMPRDVVYYGLEKSLYMCMSPAGTGISPYNASNWQVMWNVSDMIVQINDYVNDTDSIYISINNNISITHNLGKYVKTLVVNLAGNTYGSDGFGMNSFGGGSNYEVLSRAEYPDLNNVKIYLNESFNGTPTITQISSTVYQVAFSEDNTLQIQIY